jgi:hypothetical protein
MSLSDGAAAEAKQLELDNELVPLAVAANVTYFHLTDVSRQVDANEHLADMLQVVSVALAQVAPIYRARADGEQPSLLSNGDIDRLLLAPLRDGAESPSLDGYCVRRGDLRKALVTLREARNLFGRAPGPA